METHRTDNNQANIIRIEDIESSDDPPKNATLPRKSTSLRNPFFKAVVTVVSSDDDNSNLEVVPVVNTATKTVVDLVDSSDESEQQVSSANNVNSSSPPKNNIDDKQITEGLDVCNSSCTLLIGNNKFLNTKSSIIDEDVTIIDIPNVLNNGRNVIIESIVIIKPPNSQSQLDCSNIVEILSDDSSDTILTESGHLNEENLLLNEEKLLLNEEIEENLLLNEEIEENLLLNEENDDIIDLDVDLTPHYEVIDETVEKDLDYSVDFTGDDNLANSTLITQNPDQIDGLISEIDTLINAKRNEITSLEQTILTKVEKRKASLDTTETDLVPPKKIKSSLSVIENVFDATLVSENEVNLAEIDSCMATVKNEIHELKNTILNREKDKTLENELISLENVEISQSIVENQFDSTLSLENVVNVPKISTDLKNTVLIKDEDLAKQKRSENEFISGENIKISISLLENDTVLISEGDSLGNVEEKEKTDLKTVSNDSRDLETENDAISSKNELISTENELISSETVLIASDELISSENELISTENELISSENVLIASDELISTENEIISAEIDSDSSEIDLISPEDIKLSLSMMETEDCDTTLIPELPEANSTMITPEIENIDIKSEKPEKPASIKSERLSVSSIHSETSTNIKLTTSVLNKITTNLSNVDKTSTKRENEDSSIKSESSTQKTTKTVKRKNNSIKSEASSKKSRYSDTTVKSENSTMMRSRSNSSCSNSSNNSSTFNNSTRSDSTWDYRRGNNNNNNNNFVPNRSDFRSNCSSSQGGSQGGFNPASPWQENNANLNNNAYLNNNANLNNNNWDNMTQFLNTMTNGLNNFLSFSDFAWNPTNNSWSSNNHTPFRCECCNHFFHTRFDLIRHTRLLSAKRYRCRFCVKPFRYENQLVEHEKEHTGNLPYPCPFSYCRKSFRTGEMLSLHKSLHDGKVKCDRCELRFSNEWKLVEHKRLHEGETLLRCLFCDVAYKPNEWDKHRTAFHGHLVDEKFFEVMRVD